VLHRKRWLPRPRQWTTGALIASRRWGRVPTASCEHSVSTTTHDSTRYGLSRSSPRTFLAHHRAAILAAVVLRIQLQSYNVPYMYSSPLPASRHELQAHHGHVALLNRPRAAPRHIHTFTNSHIHNHNHTFTWRENTCACKNHASSRCTSHHTRNRHRRRRVCDSLRWPRLLSLSALYPIPFVPLPLRHQRYVLCSEQTVAIS
jgi:hypothetical protein